MKLTKNSQSGFISIAAVSSIVLGILVLVFGSIMIWALVNYNEAKNVQDSEIQASVEAAKEKQRKELNSEFDEKEKEPLKEFVGPTDLGRVTFNYPKTWSVYVDNPGLKNTFSAYLHPSQVPSVSIKGNKFALRVYVYNTSYEQLLSQYAKSVQKGELRSSSVTTSGFKGTRFDGTVEKGIEGSAVLFKIRDKTLIMQTDSPSFRSDFDSKIVKSLSFQQ